MTQKIAVLLPCYNEETTIGQVVHAFRRVLPEAAIYVYDNNSQDATRARAEEAGAIVRAESRQGKGNVVRRMFADVDADIYIMADGDGTYDATCAPVLIQKLLTHQLDMVVGTRVPVGEACYRPGHVLGNRIFTGAVGMLFGTQFTDILSGYRVFSKRFVKSFPSLSGGFEIETELTVHALSMKLPVGEVETPYAERPEGSISKLSTYKDGIRIAWMIFMLVKEELPFFFFTVISFFFFCAALLLLVPVVLTFWETGLVPRFPSLIVAGTALSISFLSFVAGVILDSVARGRQEIKRLAYLSYPSSHSLRAER